MTSETRKKFERWCILWDRSPNKIYAIAESEVEAWGDFYKVYKDDGNPYQWLDTMKQLGYRAARCTVEVLEG